MSAEPTWLQQARERQKVRRQALMKQWAKRSVPPRGVKALIAEQDNVPLPDELQALVESVQNASTEKTTEKRC